MYADDALVIIKDDQISAFNTSLPGIIFVTNANDKAVSRLFFSKITPMLIPTYFDIRQMVQPPVR